MAYDPNDPETKAALQAAIEAALEAERETHTSEVDRLNNKNKDLLGKIAKLRKDGGGENTGEIERLEGELETVGRELTVAKSELRETGRKLKTAETERDTLRTQAETESNYSRNLLVTNGLTDALTEAKVAPHFMEAARALLAGKVKVEVDGDERKLLADGKPVKEFVKEWAASDAGKHYVLAPANGGSGSTGANGGGNPNSGGKALKDMSEPERVQMERDDPIGFKTLLDAEGPTVTLAA